MHPPRLERVRQSTHHVLLPKELSELLRTIFACESGIGHGEESVPTNSGGKNHAFCRRQRSHSLFGNSKKIAVRRFSSKVEAARTSSPPAPDITATAAPSGPDGICGWSSRRNRCEPPWTAGCPGPREDPAEPRERTGGESGIRTHVYPCGHNWNSSPAPSTARPSLRRGRIIHARAHLIRLEITLEPPAAGEAAGIRPAALSPC